MIYYTQDFDLIKHLNYFFLHRSDYINTVPHSVVKRDFITGCFCPWVP